MASATSIVVGVLVGGVLQFLIQVPSLVQKGMKFNFGVSFSHPAIRNVASLMIPRLFGIGIGQINLFVDTRFATAAGMPEGSLAALYLADRVMELVLGGYAIAVATAILPSLDCPCSSLLCRWASSPGLSQADRPGFLFHAGYQDAGHRGLYLSRHKRRPEHSFPGNLPIQTRPERWSRPRHSARDFF